MNTQRGSLFTWIHDFRALWESARGVKLIQIQLGLWKEGVRWNFINHGTWGKSFLGFKSPNKKVENGLISI